MPIIIDGREIKIPEEIPVAREAFGVPDGACFGCYLGDDGLEMHDLCLSGRAWRELQQIEEEETAAREAGRRDRERAITRNENGRAIRDTTDATGRRETKS